jgi:arsenate reductase (glutaredoxin)
MSQIIIYQYPKCSTCRKAVKFLRDRGVDFAERHIVDTPPNETELRQLVAQSGLPLKNFFNTSGKKYRELQLSKRLSEMSEAEQISLLASDGMLLKRPIVSDGTRVTVGFQENSWKETWV